MLKISEKLLLGEGGTKVAYRHPEDSDICVKFPSINKKRAQVDLLREIKYLKKHQDRLPFLAQYIDEVETNQGTGYMYQLIRNEDGSPSKDLTHHLNDLDKVCLKKKIVKIYHALIEEHALMSDMQLANIFIIEKLSGDYDLCFVDGFGNSDFIKICDVSKFFFMNKLNRKFEKLFRKLGMEEEFEKVRRR